MLVISRPWTVLGCVELAVIVIMLPLGHVFSGSLVVHQAQMLVLAVTGAAGWCLVLWRPAALGWPALLMPLPLLAALVITALPSAYPSLSWPAVWHTTAYAGIFWLLTYQASHPVGRRILITVIGIVLMVAIIVFLMAVVLAWRAWLGLGFPLTSLPLRPLNAGGLALIPTYLADVVVLGGPVLVGYLWSRGARSPAIAVGVFALGAVVLTGTRSVLLLLAIVAAVATLPVIRRHVGKGVMPRLILGVVALGIIGSLVVLGSSRAFDEGRASAYTSAVARFAESPLLGTGPGTYSVKRMRDPVELIGHLAFPDAHNIVLNTAAESGIAGLVGLAGTLALAGVAIRRSWRSETPDRLAVGGALSGLAVFAGHGMVDVVFALIGIVIAAVAVFALAATTAAPSSPIRDTRLPFIRLGLGTALLVAVFMSGAVIRTEVAFRTVAEADAALASTPAEAFAMGRRATDGAADLVPGWWIQMVAADRVGDLPGSIEAARRLIALEGFGQQWITLAILESRNGDHAGSAAATRSATAHLPIDPMVELNAIGLLLQAGDARGADAAAGRLLEVQPDIEAIVRIGSPEIASVVGGARHDTAAKRIADQDATRAFLIALHGEDRELADRLLRQLTPELGDVGQWAERVNAWFGDRNARASLDAAARARPTSDRSLWSWRLAGRVCDEDGMSFWERALSIGYSIMPAVPNGLLVAPSHAARDLPPRYPIYVWRLDYPRAPYVAGTLTITRGRPACDANGA